MNCINRKQYEAIIENIDIRETDTILEIGFGNGFLLQKLSEQNPQKLYGIDISSDMIKTTAKKCKKEIEQGKIELFLANIQDLPFEKSSINKVYTVNTTYYLQDIQQGFSEIKRVLKPDGIFLNVIYLKEWLDKLPITKYGFSKYNLGQIEKITTESGFKIEYIIEIQRRKSICIIARKILE
jgi:ubiquinone/menaquinone biosynthesis C-methylase UbiE